MDSTRRRYLKLSLATTTTVLAGCKASFPDSEDPIEQIDDWQYDPNSKRDSGMFQSAPNSGSGGLTAPSVSAGSSSPQAEADLGMATGGAKNIGDFRRNIEEGYLPLPESLAYEGLFYNYYFDTGTDQQCNSLFCPSYARAVSEDPLGSETERYVTVGLNSNLTTETFDRKQLNVVIVLDISGSMGAQFSEYYYDRFGNKHDVEDGSTKSKMEVARDALVALTEQLNPEDRVGVVLFNNDAHLAKPLNPVERTDMDAIRSHIREDIQAGGGTNIGAGMEEATTMLGEYGADQTETETRQIVITDAMPNTGNTGGYSLRETLAEYAENNIHTSFIGVGVDFNPELVDKITAVRGANYRAVHSAESFETYLGEEFEYMVTPLVYDLDVELDSEGYSVAKVYGSTAAEEATDDLIKVNTLFPSPQSEGKTRGGVVLVQVDKTQADAEMELTATWEDRSGSTGQTTRTITFSGDPEHFDNTGVRKAVLLSRYADLLKNWLIYEREPNAVTYGPEITVPPEDPQLGNWEQQSQDLTVSEGYASRIREFKSYFASEMDAIGDDSLNQEIEMMETILAAAE